MLDACLKFLSKGLALLSFFASVSPLVSFRPWALLSSSLLLDLPPLVADSGFLAGIVPFGRGEELGFCILDFRSSARFFQMLTAGSGASCSGTTGAFLPFFTLSEVLSTASTDLSTEVEACDLLSQVDSEEAFGSEDTSSSLVTVEAEDAEAPRSGEDMFDVSTEWAGGADVDVDVCG